jgi:hypothetical protein
MRRNAIHSPIFAMAIAALLTSSATARAGPVGTVLYSQPYDGVSAAVPSQIFTDTSPSYSSWNTQAFDDFTVTGNGWLVTGATFYGQEQGDPTQNVSVNMQFLQAPGFTTTGISGGTEDATGNLNFNGLNIFLAPGTYWISAWVNRPELTGGQWFWDMTDVGNPNGSEFSIQNPGGSLLQDSNGNPLAANPTPGSQVYGTPPADLAFTLVGQAAPEPSSIVLLATGGVALALLSLARRRRGRAVRRTAPAMS